jgi:prepilin-type N-terminal cleavage/methylation domain-containing protein
MRTAILKPRGFSLIELLISTAIATLIGSAILLVLVSQTRLTASQNRNMLNADQVRGVMNFMADEIQMMGHNVPEPYIETADQRDFTFYSDIDNDGVRDRIRYWYDPLTTTTGQLKRTLSTSPDGLTWTVVGTDVLIPNIDNGSAATKDVGGHPNTPTGFAFTYFAKDGATPADTSQITAVQINLGLDISDHTTAATGKGLAPQYFVTMATIRNRSRSS